MAFITESTEVSNDLQPIIDGFDKIHKKLERKVNQRFAVLINKRGVEQAKEKLGIIENVMVDLKSKNIGSALSYLTNEIESNINQSSERIASHNWSIDSSELSILKILDPKKAERYEQNINELIKKHDEEMSENQAYGM